MKKMNILGISLTDYSLKEALKLSNQYLYSGALHTISYISTQILVEAVENPQQKEWLEEMDMTVCGEVDILRAAGLDTRNRLREVENDEFLKEFLHKLSRNKRKAYLIAKDEEELEKLEDYLRSYSWDLVVEGSYVVDMENKNVESLVNDINDVVPNVVISRLPYPVQEKLMNDCKKIVNANIWLALLEHANIHTQRSNPFEKFSHYLYRKIFNRKVNKYNQE